MAETYTLTDPEVTQKVTTDYKVVFVMKNRDTMVLEFGVRGTNGEYISARYSGANAENIMRQMNKANFTTKSEQKTILEKMRDDGFLPPGNVTGTPE